MPGSLEQLDPFINSRSSSSLQLPHVIWGLAVGEHQCVRLTLPLKVTRCLHVGISTQTGEVGIVTSSFRGDKRVWEMVNLMLKDTQLMASV